MFFFLCVGGCEKCCGRMFKCVLFSSFPPWFAPFLGRQRPARLAGHFGLGTGGGSITPPSTSDWRCCDAPADGRSDPGGRRNRFRALVARGVTLFMQIRAENARGNQPPDARAAPPNFPGGRDGAADAKSGAASASPDGALLDHARPPSDPAARAREARPPSELERSPDAPWTGRFSPRFPFDTKPSETPGQTRRTKGRACVTRRRPPGVTGRG